MSLTFVHAPRISKGLFRQILERAGSPAAPEADALFDACVSAGIDSAVALAFFKHESQLGTTGINVTYNLRNWGSVRTSYNPAMAIGSVTVPGNGVFVRYATWTRSLLDWCQRILHWYVGAGLDTVEKAIPKYAPAADHNNEAAYIRAVETSVAAWIAMETAVPETKGWMPGVTHVDPKDMPAGNYEKGRDGHAIEAVVEHIAEGSYAGTVSWFKNPASGVSSTFVISKKGEITQVLNIYDTSYANGLRWNGSTWIDPEGSAVKPPWKRLRPPLNPIYQTVTIENEGDSGDVWTQPQTDANVRVLQYLRSEVPLVYAVHDTLIGHNEISPVNRAHCPGTGCHLDTLAAAANGTPPEPHPTMVFLKTTVAANVRQGPGTTFPIALVMAAGESAGFDGDTPGEVISGNGVWCHRADSLGFVWSGLLVPA